MRAVLFKAKAATKLVAAFISCAVVQLHVGDDRVTKLGTFHFGGAIH